MTRFGFIVCAAALAMSGAGCLPKPASSLDPAAAAHAVGLRPGMTMIIRPSAFGLTGTIDAVLGNDREVLQATVRRAGTESAIVLDWKSDSATGTVAFRSQQDMPTMFLPAFWPPGEVETQSEGLWMPPAAFAKLNEGQPVEWCLGLADRAVSAASAALKAFHAAAARLTSASSSAAISPFQFKKTGASETFPLLLDGRVVFVRVVRAESWLADALILDNPDNPLILKLVIHPAAQPALQALAPSFFRWNELDYEITGLSNS